MKKVRIAIKEIKVSSSMYKEAELFFDDLTGKLSPKGIEKYLQKRTKDLENSIRLAAWYLVLEKENKSKCAAGALKKLESLEGERVKVKHE